MRMSLRIFNRWFDYNVENKRNTNNNFLNLNQIASSCFLHTACLTSKDLRNYIFSARDRNHHWRSSKPISAVISCHYIPPFSPHAYDIYFKKIKCLQNKIESVLWLQTLRYDLILFKIKRTKFCIPLDFGYRNILEILHFCKKKKKKPIHDNIGNL